MARSPTIAQFFLSVFASFSPAMAWDGFLYLGMVGGMHDERGGSK